MQKLVLIALVVALAAASAHPRYVDAHQSLAQIDADPFGNIVLSTIKAHIQAQTPANEINMLLNAVGAGIAQDQSEHDHVNRTDQTAFNQISSDLENNINYHNLQINVNTKLRDDTTEALAQSEVDIRETIKDIASNEDTFAREQATREAQHALWVSKTAAIDDVIEAIDDASKLIQHLSLGASFAQVRTKYEAIHKKLSESNEHTAILQPVITALTELATHGVNQKALTRISQLLSEIRQNLVAEKADKLQTEERQAANWAAFSAHLTNEHARLVERKSQLEVTIQEQKDTIEDANEWIEFHTVELEVAVEALAEIEAWEANEQELYETQTAERAGQQEVVDRLQEHISEKLAGTAQYVARR
ncbi:hypothetical protein pb186bvf_016597 [Paramecium bursaria]